MARWAIGDIQGCDAELAELLQQLHFNPDRDRLWIVGDLVNRGPQSLQVLRRLHALRDNVICVLGNHDLHLLALALAGARPRAGDTLQAILAAPDREPLLAWLLSRPLAHYDAVCGDLLLHAGVLPGWDVGLTLALAREVEQALQHDPAQVLGQMYGNEPQQWSSELRGAERWRLCINALTRLRFCSADGRLNLRLKGGPASAPAPWLPWFACEPPARAEARIIFGHWSALGFLRAQHLLALDTGCVWGGALTAVNLDAPVDAAEPGDARISVASQQPRTIEF